MTASTDHLANEQLAPGATRYVGEWGLFADWCAVTGRTALPADAATVEAFLRACPAAAATLARRVTAIDRRHRDSGVVSPRRTTGVRDLVRGRPARPVREPFDPDAVDAALRALPITGWTAGWFGRRDRALLVLAAAGVSYRRIVQLTAVDLQLTEGAVTIPAGGRDQATITAANDPTVCRACAVGRWLRILNLDATTNAKTVIDALQRQKRHPTNPVHICQQPQPIDPRTGALPLFPPIDPHGATHLDHPVPLTRQSISELARQAVAGRHATHKIVPLRVGTSTEADGLLEAAPPAYSVEQYQRGIEQRAVDSGHLAELGGTLDDIDARIAELETKTKALLAGGDGV